MEGSIRWELLTFRSSDLCIAWSQTGVVMPGVFPDLNPSSLLRSFHRKTDVHGSGGRYLHVPIEPTGNLFMTDSVLFSERGTLLFSWKFNSSFKNKD